MIGKTTYKRKLFFYFLSVFIVFSTIITIIQYNREKAYKARELDSILDTYSEFVNSFILHHNISENKNFILLDSLKEILPRKDIRITVIDLTGNVVYDSHYKDFTEMANHIGRPEVKDALLYKKGTNIRLSESTNQDFYYYAKKYDKYFIRPAVVYSHGIKQLLSVESLYWLFIAILFLLISSIILYVSDTVGKSILKLKDFAIKAAKNESIDMPLDFPENELGEIGEQIVNIYNRLNSANKELLNEKDKLIHHLQMSQEGLAVFSNSNKKILANNHFMQYLNLISDKPTVNAELFLELKEFKPVASFLKDSFIENSLRFDKTPPVKRITIEKNMRIFDVQCIIFHDKSYEISINDITKTERQKKLKQQMTSNIAHELRTPVSSIKGYLETILSSDDLPLEKQRYFIEKASAQIERLSELIRDISLLNNIEEASNLFEIEEVNINTLINDVIENLQAKIKEKNLKIKCIISEPTKIKGNKALLYSVFQNLLENSINYAGENVSVFIEKYLEDENNIYFSFSDSGEGIDEKHLPRIFERFYRVDKGRARNTGGTGLGLAIVKNAIHFHKGEISVKTRKEGGVEFLFSFNKTHLSER